MAKFSLLNKEVAKFSNFIKFSSILSLVRILPRTLKGKIILATVCCIIIVGVPSNLLLYRFLGNIIDEKVTAIDEAWLSGERDEIQDVLDRANIMASWFSYNTEIRGALSYSSLSEENAAVAAIAAQNTLSNYISASGIEDYIRKALLFNDDGLAIQANTNRDYGALNDAEKIKETEMFKKAQRRSFVSTGGSYSISSGSPCVCVIAPIASYGWVYIELAFNLFDKLFSGGSNYMDVYIISDAWSLPETVSEEEGLAVASLSGSDLTIAVKTDASALRQDRRQVILIAIAVTLVATAAAALLAYVLTGFITKPVNRLITHIKHIGEDGDFTPSKEIEKGNDEIAEIGRTVNDMSVSINSLIKKNEELHEQTKNAEIVALQSQVNPHFLYNTLESIRYMAQVQKSPGIAEMSRGLSSLLKNLAKGQNDRISLSKELELVRDYDNIQQVRYMGMYDIVYNVPSNLMEYRILKFTLQPLVENAIFHGIEPTGRMGTVTISAFRDGDYLYIDVKDDGAGMEKEEIERLLKFPKARSANTLTGVGLRNVDERLRLTYGAECGLSISSKEGKGTRVRLKLKVERGTDEV